MPADTEIDEQATAQDDGFDAAKMGFQKESDFDPKAFGFEPEGDVGVPPLRLPEGVSAEAVASGPDESYGPLEQLSTSAKDIFDVVTHPVSKAQDLLNKLTLPKDVKPAPHENPFRLEVGPGLRKELVPYGKGA